MVTEATCPTPHLRGGDFYFAARLVSWMRVCGARAPGHVCACVRGAHIRASQTEETDVRRFVSHLRSGGRCGRRGEPLASESLSRKQVLETEAGSEPAAPTFHGPNAPGRPASGPLGAHSRNSHGPAWQGATGSDPATCHSIRRLPPPPRVGRAGADPRAHCVTAQCPHSRR